MCDLYFLLLVTYIFKWPYIVLIHIEFVFVFSIFFITFKLTWVLDPFIKGKKAFWMSFETGKEGRKRGETPSSLRKKRKPVWMSVYYGLHASFHYLIYYSSWSTAGGSSLNYKWKNLKAEWQEGPPTHHCEAGIQAQLSGSKAPTKPLYINDLDFSPNLSQCISNII